jgi:hypothetical protein
VCVFVFVCLFVSLSLSVAHGHALMMLIEDAAECQDGVGESLMVQFVGVSLLRISQIRSSS